MSMTIQAEAASDNPHIVLVPFMAQGHIIPMIDIARLLANRGATVTFITTPLNAARIQPIIDNIERSRLPIRFLPLRFPCAEAGLPDGTENADALPSRDLAPNFFNASSFLLTPLINHLRSQSPPPNCVISDFCHPWTHKLALEFNIPRFVFHGNGSFLLLCMHNIRLHGILDDATDENKNEPFVVPGLPDRIELTRAHTPGFFVVPSIEKFMQESREAEALADGVVVNTFDQLEPAYSDLYPKAINKKVWTIGPTCLHNNELADVAVRGIHTNDHNSYLTWLDSMETDSVIYVSFGSLAYTALAQLIEIGLGLEGSNCKFIWAVKAGGENAEVEEWLTSSGFEERVKGRGLLLRGWAQQVMILSHRAVGGFMMHCGWNSTLEAVSAGVPMVTWPQFADQFLNERLLVDVLSVGVAIGAKPPTRWDVEVEHMGEAMVKREAVEKAVRALMDEGDDTRKRAKGLEKKAKEAMGEGGSSNDNLGQLLEHIAGATM